MGGKTKHPINFLFVIAVNHLPDGSSPITPSEKPPRSSSQTKPTGRKSKSSSLSAIKRKYGKALSHNGEPKWYLESSSSGNTNNNNNNDNNNTNMSSAISTPNADRPSRKLGKLKKILFLFLSMIR